MKAYDARDIANFILDRADDRGIEISHLALQKLLYFIHGWFYSIYNEPLIRNKFEAWKYGPVQRVLYDQFKKCGDKPIGQNRAKHLDPLTGEQIFKSPNLEQAHAEIISLLFEKYARFTASQLVEMSHEEDSPWECVWRQAEEFIYPGMQIPDEIISCHFKSLSPILTFH